MRTKKNVAARRVATLVAALGMLAMSSGAVLMVTATSANADPISQPNSNHEDHWEVAEGEVCAKTDSGSETGGVLVPAPPADTVWSKLVIKKGSGNIGVENQVFNNPVPGQTYTWVGFEEAQSGGWSHYILCYVPIPEPELIEVDVEFTEPTCENENEASYTVTGDTDNVTVDSNTPAEPGANVTVTVTAKDGFVFAGDETTYEESHLFAEAETPCDEVVEPPVVEPPVVDPPDSTVATPTTPSVVSAGLATDVRDVRGEQGLVLLVAGMIMVVLAGGLGLRTSRR